MFGWNIAKSAEAVFSRWAIKHVLKFLLKKKLGQFILGDLDLDQLDVQLGDGTIQLSDLSLNVEYINQKLGASQVIVKEGSIGSLSIKIPWRVQNCQIEVEEVELVLVPCVRNDLSSEGETSNSTEDCKQLNADGSEKLDHEIENSTSTSISLDVHEGVKKIAKMVKWLLTSFHVKVKKLIIAYDPCSDKDERISGSHRALVLRVTEIEYGTCVSEDADASPNAQVESFLGMTKLTNFIRFEGAIVELLRMDDVDNHTQTPCALGTTFSEWCMGSLPSDAISQILTGENGGFSGNVKLSMPWKDGSLDVHKVDADVLIDPLEVRLRLNTIIWIIKLYQSLLEKDGRCHNQCKAADSVYHDSESQFRLSTPGSPLITKDQVTSCENSSVGFCSIGSQGTRGHNALLQESHVIPDWVPLSYAKQNCKAEEESDLGASIDHFFECFDGLRSSQSSLSNSGMWNLTCSVFSAITAASSLASGSLHIPSEQMHIEMNFKAKVAGVSIALFLHDEKPQHSCEFLDNLASGAQNIHHLEARFRDLLLVFQVLPHEMKFDAKIKHIELDDYLNSKSEAAVSGFLGGESCVYSQNLLVEQLQAQVQGTLPVCTLFQDPDLEETISRSCGTDFHCRPAPKSEILSDTGYKTFTTDDPAKVKLLKTSGVTHCEVTVYSTRLNGNLGSSTSFSLNLPTFIVWVNFNMVTMLLDLLKQIGNSFELKNKCTGSGNFNERRGPVCHEDVREGNCQCFTTLSSKGSLKGSIFPTNTRVILCFPFNDHGGFEQYLYCNQFIGLDILNQQSKETISGAHSRDGGLQQAFCNKAATSIHLKIESLNIYLITSECGDAVGWNSCSIGKCTYSSQNILSVTSGTDCFPGISMFWQGDSETGPLIGNKARSLATSQDSTRCRNSVGSKGYEFASATTLGDMKDINFHAREEIILSSAFFLRICLPPICVQFGSLHYQLLCRMMSHVMDGLSSAPINTNKTSGENIKKKVAPASQTSVLMKCDSVKFLINLDKVEDSKCPLQKELSGSWQNLKLQVEKLELLSVSNLGGVSGGNLFWLGHGEGKLWGSVDEFSSNELLLISCSNSTVQRGDGVGTNALSLGSAGSEIVYLRDPQVFQRSTHIAIKGSTIIAPGGRLDWFNSLCNFFSLPDCENDQTHNDSVHKEFSDDGTGYGSSFVLNLVDVALSYEPHVNYVVTGYQTLESGSSTSANVSEEQRKKYIACVLASASLNLSNQILANSKDNDYKIRLQDLGLLICPWFGPKDARASYDVEYLNKTGFVKVAGEALVEAILRTNCKNGLQWELVFSDSHINLDTCPDTTSGLINLAAQLQEIFSPDVRESVVHLQSRWKTVQEAQSRHDIINEKKINNSGSTSLPSCMETPFQDRTSSSGCGITGLLDEISENAFNFNGNVISASDEHQLKSHISVDEDLLGKMSNSNISDAGFLSQSVSNGPITRTGLESDQATLLRKDSFAEVLEGYCVTGLCPLLEMSAEVPRLDADFIYKSSDEGFDDVKCGDSAWYRCSSPRIVENYIPMVSEKPVGTKIPEVCEFSSINHKKPDGLCDAKGRILLKNIGVRWRMYAGSDWHDKNLQHAANASGRDTSTCLELTLSGMDVMYDIFPDGDVSASKLSLSVQDFHLYDCSMNAPWKLVLGYYHSKDRPRESSAKAFKLDLEAVRPDPSIPLEENRLRVAFLPMLLHLDQDQLDFLISFFGGRGSPIDQSPAPLHDPDGSNMLPMKNSDSSVLSIAEEALLPFFQKFDVRPFVVRVDYSPRHIDLAALRGGNYVHLVNLVSWKGVELHLKQVHAVGVYGWSSVCETIVGEWLEDISHNQIHKFLKGLSPIRSLFTVGSGAAKLVLLPVKNYRNDHRLIKGIQRGAMAFLRSISLEAVGLGVHLAAGAHDILLQTEYILTSIPPSVNSPARSKTETNVRSNQPEDAQQGIQQAYESLSDGLSRTASALVGTPLKTYQRGAGAGSALATAVCAAPAAAIAPASAAMRALHCALLGVRNSLDPEHKKESMEKYLGPTQHPNHS